MSWFLTLLIFLQYLHLFTSFKSSNVDHRCTNLILFPVLLIRREFQLWPRALYELLPLHPLGYHPLRLPRYLHLSHLHHPPMITTTMATAKHLRDLKCAEGNLVILKFRWVAFCFQVDVVVACSVIVNRSIAQPVCGSATTDDAIPSPMTWVSNKQPARSSSTVNEN